MNRFFSYQLLALALVPLLLVFAACDSGGDEDEEHSNEFTLNVSSTSSSSALSPKSARDTTLTGFSFFYAGEDPETGQHVFAIYLNGTENFSETSAQEGLYGFFARKSTQPSSGTYTVNDMTETEDLDNSNFIGLIYEDMGTQQGSLMAPFYFSESGTITLDESSGNRVSGSLDIMADAFTIDTTGSTLAFDTTDVHITGSFSAQNVENFALFQPNQN